MTDEVKLFDPYAGTGFTKLMQGLVDHFKEDDATPLKEGFYRCDFSAKDRLAFTEQNKASMADLKQADIICLGGIDHTQQMIGALPSKLADWLAANGVTDMPKMVTHNTKYMKIDRFTDVYSWNAKKTFVSDEMMEVANEIWNAKFLDDNKHLLDPKDFKGFSFATYSFGARMSFMIENQLREWLRAEGCEPDKIAQYFAKIKRVSIASSVDVAISDENRSELKPAITTTHLISQADTGVAYWTEFYKKCIDETADAGLQEFFNKHTDYARIDLGNSELFTSRDGKHIEGEGHTVLLFKRSLPPPDANDKGHGLSTYILHKEKEKTSHMDRLTAEDKKLLIDELLISTRQRPGQGELPAPPKFLRGVIPTGANVQSR